MDKNRKIFFPNYHLMLTLRPTELRIEISYNSNNRNNNHVNANLRKSDD